MAKSCKNCRHYSLDSGYCYEKDTTIIDKMGATYCKTYKEKRKLPRGDVKCIYCANLNKYNWCSVKKRCFDETEKEKLRQCIKFKGKKKRFRQKINKKSRIL